LLQGADVLAVADLSASETKKITAKDLVQAGVALIDPGSIPGDKVTLAIPANSIGTAELKDDAVTQAKLADNSSGVVGASFPGAGAFIGQLALNATTGKAVIWNGAAWAPFNTTATVNTVTGGTTGPVVTDATVVSGAATVVARISDTTAKAQFLAGPAATAGAVTLRGITSADLPEATNVDLGGVTVPAGGGLTVAGGALSLTNTVAASGTPFLVTYDTHGQVTSGRLIASGDLPLATTGGPGAVAGGTEFTVQPSGALIHTNQIAAGTGIKITYDAQGHVKSSGGLADADIPDLPASKITSGTIAPAVLGDKSITRSKLADYAIAYIQEATPSLTGVPIGELWYQESTAGLHMWNGNSWMPISIGRLSQENLRYCGLIDAATGLITGVTSFGTAASYKIGDALRAASDADTGVYFVVETAGNGIGVTTGITYDPGDWVLCSGHTAGWQRIDTLSSGSGGGGGGVARLNDLLDVTLTSPGVGQVLVYNATGQWVNTDVLDCGTY